MSRTPIKHHFKKNEEAKYSIKNVRIADNFDVSLNNMYRKLDSSLPEIKEGQEIECVETPCYYFKYKGKIWPVYSDDAGQQTYIYIDDECRTSGSYNFFDIEYFCHEIDKHYKGNNKNEKI